MAAEGVRAAPGKVRRAVRRRLAASNPVLTVVIPVYNVAAYLPECLDSVLGQTLSELEVIAVDDGSTDSSPDILRDRARRDPRLRVITQANSGQGVARNVAVAQARGEFLTFCDADDTVPPRAYAHMVGVLRETGSDFVVGAARRVAAGKNLGVAFRDAHLVDRLGTTIEETPVAMQDIIACNRVVRTAFWVDRVPAYRGHIAYEDHVPGLAAYVRAERFDLLTNVTYNWRVREDNTSTGQQKANLENLLDRIAVKEEASELLLAEAPPAVYAAWVGRCLSVDFPPFLAHGLVGNDMYRNVLSATYRTFLDRASTETWLAVPQVNRLRGWLCAQGRWSDLAAVDERIETRGRLPRTEVRDGLVLAVREPSLADVPDELWQMSEQETGLIAAVRSVHSPAPGTVRISGFAAIRALDCSHEAPQTQAWLHDPSSGRTVPLSVEQYADPAANVWTSHLNASYDHAAFQVDVPATELGTDPDTTWVLHLKVSQQGVVREGTVHTAVEGSAGHHLRPVDVGSGSVTPALSGALGLHLTVNPDNAGTGDEVADAVLRDVELTDGTLVLTMETPDGRRPAPLRHQTTDLEPTYVEQADLEPGGDVEPAHDEPGGDVTRIGFGLASLPDGDLLLGTPDSLTVAPDLWQRLPVALTAGDPASDDLASGHISVVVLVRRTRQLVLRLSRTVHS
ncbi:glycosyltransferase family 2 protein [Nocardioides sp. Soil796]|uniref:glycosyltransferase family 2 protein n=1 Tax=Nocardioides sp. Soil796 TaxID=1736412 RepID=UPI00070F1C91|nr:glycosyltransferase family 2 protein [Nocardioides sp. Soil796]KRF14912.1 hypothetical protein ASH02_11630 [Nocardioides sp. Soil796]